MRVDDRSEFGGDGVQVDKVDIKSKRRFIERIDKMGSGGKIQRGSGIDGKVQV